MSVSEVVEEALKELKEQEKTDKKGKSEYTPRKRLASAFRVFTLRKNRVLEAFLAELEEEPKKAAEKPRSGSVS